MGNLELTNAQNLNQSGYSGYGAVLTVSRVDADEFPGSFVAALMGITAINIRTNVIPSYHMRSKGRFQSFAPGLRDGGEVAAAVNWLPGANDTQGKYAADWSLLRQATLESNELTRIRVFAPDPDLHLIRIDGFLTQLGPFSYQPEAIMSGQVGWKIVGSPDIVTPIVFEVSGESYVANLNPISRPGASESGSVSTTIRLGGQNVRVVIGKDDVPDIKLAFTYSVDTKEEYLSATVSGTNVSVVDGLVDPPVAITTPHPVAPGDAWIRLYIPGRHELWLPHPATSAEAFTLGGPGVDASALADPVLEAAAKVANEQLAKESLSVKRFQDAYKANGYKCFAAVYGSDDVL